MQPQYEVAAAYHLVNRIFSAAPTVWDGFYFKRQRPRLGSSWTIGRLHTASTILRISNHLAGRVVLLCHPVLLAL